MAPSTPPLPWIKQKAISESCGLSVNFSFSGQVVFQKILEIFSYIYTCETISPLMAPPELRGPWSLQTWFCTMLLSFHVLFSFSGTVILLQKIFEICFYKNICKNSFPHCGLTRPLGPWFSQLWFYITWGCCHISFNILGQMVLEKKIF